VNWWSYVVLFVVVRFFYRHTVYINDIFTRQVTQPIVSQHWKTNDLLFVAVHFFETQCIVLLFLFNPASNAAILINHWLIKIVPKMQWWHQGGARQACASAVKPVPPAGVLQWNRVLGQWPYKKYLLLGRYLNVSCISYKFQNHLWQCVIFYRTLGDKPTTLFSPLEIIVPQLCHDSKKI